MFCVSVTSTICFLDVGAAKITSVSLEDSPGHPDNIIGKCLGETEAARRFTWLKMSPQDAEQPENWYYRLETVKDELGGKTIVIHYDSLKGSIIGVCTFACVACSHHVSALFCRSNATPANQRIHTLFQLEEEIG